MVSCNQYSVDLYQTLEAETGQAVSFHQVGNLRLARDRDRMDEYRNYMCTAETIGVDAHLIGVDELKKLWPMALMEGFVGGLWHPVDLTMALAMGVEIYLHTLVEYYCAGQG